MFATALAALLAGCGSAKVDPVATANPETIGYLVGTVGQRPGEPYSYYRMSVCDEKRLVATSFDYRIRLYPFETPDQKEILQPGFSGNSFVLPLPAGRYSLCTYAFTGDGIEPTPKNAFSQPIIVEAQKVNYVGRFMGITTYEKNLYGNPVPAGGYWVVTNAQAEDLPYIAKRNPASAGLPLAQIVPGPLLQPYFYNAIQPAALDPKAEPKP
jgi:hypothetical protein